MMAVALALQASRNVIMEVSPLFASYFNLACVSCIVKVSVPIVYLQLKIGMVSVLQKLVVTGELNIRVLITGRQSHVQR